MCQEVIPSSGLLEARGQNQQLHSLFVSLLQDLERFFLWCSGALSMATTCHLEFPHSATYSFHTYSGPFSYSEAEVGETSSEVQNKILKGGGHCVQIERFTSLALIHSSSEKQHSNSTACCFSLPRHVPDPSVNSPTGVHPVNYSHVFKYLWNPREIFKYRVQHILTDSRKAIQPLWPLFPHLGSGNNKISLLPGVRGKIQ